ncbi:MAG: diaminopimelate epimerase [Thermoleophilia bacterium]
MSDVFLAKWQGLGNDYLIIERDALPGPLSAEATALLCDRHRGFGADGILVNDEPTGAVEQAVARMRILNPDGSEPEMCGNGIRMFARYLEQKGVVRPGEEFVVETLAGPVRPTILRDGRVRVGMGTARFQGASLAGVEGEAVEKTLEALGRSFTFTFVDVGNPHCVIVVEDLTDLPLAEVGPAIEHLPLFPNRVNVEFIRPETDGSVAMRVWERGVGETQACGTGATAVGAAAVRLGLARSPVLVHLLGGDLEIEVEEGWQMVMTGPAEAVYLAEPAPELMERLGWNPPPERLRTGGLQEADDNRGGS